MVRRLNELDELDVVAMALVVVVVVAAKAKTTGAEVGEDLGVQHS